MNPRVLDAGLLVLRLGFGVVFFVYHGWAKLSAGPERWESVGAAMGHYGVTFWPMLWGFLASFAESVGALMIAAGFFFRPVCVLLAFTMLTAATGHIVTGNGTPAHALKNLFVAAGLAVIGPGRYSVDAWIARRRTRSRADR